jgi:pSer/pThr/pTyr-binding forkhead associated (FHA) protein
MSSTPQTTDKRPSTSCLVGLVGAAEGRRLPLDGARLLLGRDASRCQLVLEHALVSREHAVFETDDDGRVVVEDLGSKQGTFVNGVAVTRQELYDGDAVGFGRGGMLAFKFQTARSLAPVRVTDGLNDVVRIGRAPDNDVVLDSPAVSRYHARVRYGPAGAPAIEDAEQEATGKDEVGG